MGRIFRWREFSVGGMFHRGNFPSRETFRWVNFPWAEFSVGGISRGVNFPWEEFSVGGSFLSEGEFLGREFSGYPGRYMAS